MDSQPGQHDEERQDLSNAVINETSTDEIQRYQEQESVPPSSSDEVTLPNDPAGQLNHIDSSMASRPEAKASALQVSPQTVSGPDETATSESSSNSWKSKVVHVFSTMSREPEPHSGRVSTASERSPRPWRTAFMRFGPLSGIFCMLLAVASIVASLGVLAGSDGQSTSDWQTSPPTILAIFTAIANLSMRYAAIQGIVIAWWYRALKGSTLAKLHWDWRSGSTLRGAVTAGRHMGLLGLACIFSTVVVIDGPLLQQSSTVVPKHHTGFPLTLNVSMSPEIPREFTGVWVRGDEVDIPGTSSPSFNKTIPTVDGYAPNSIFTTSFRDVEAPLSALYQSNAPLTGVVSGCPNVPGTICKAKIQAPALAVTACSSHQSHADYMAHFANEDSSMISVVAPPLTNDAFIVTPSILVGGSREVVNLITAYTTMQDCKDGTLNLTVCSLESAIGEYDITIDHRDIATLDSPGTPRIIAIANNTDVNVTFDAAAPGHRSTLGGIVSLAFSNLYEFAFYFPSKGGIPTALSSGTLFDAYQKSSDTTCPSLKDPHDDIVTAMNKMMVYTGIIAARKQDPSLLSKIDPGITMSTQITGYVHKPQNVFHTNYWYFLAATLVELICIAFVAPTYWGWWQLGRPCSFSPLELSKAFEAPMLNECNSNSSGRDLAKTVGDVRVQYGAIPLDDASGGSKIAFADVSHVSRPQKDMRFDV